jgi:probable HAF family extracellular repeat protein
MTRIVRVFALLAAFFSLLLVVASSPLSQNASSLTYGGFRYVKIDVPGASATNTSGINARGDIVGGYSDSGGGTHGFLLRQGVFSNIDFPNASLTAARGINARGDIVGRILGAAGDEHGFLLRDETFSQIDFPGASGTTARGINNAGDITGRHFDNAGNENGFIVKDGTFNTVHVPGSCSTDVWLAMDNGRVLVGDFCTDADNGIHGYVRNKPGDFENIDFPQAGAPCTAVRWINERGDIVGVYANSLTECYSFQLHGFLLANGKYTAIDFPGAVYTSLLAINDDGEMVGQFTDQKGNTHGFKAAPKDE